jgi:exonuclease III
MDVKLITMSKSILISRIILFLLIFLLYSLFNGCNQRVNNPEETVVPDSQRINIPAFGTDSSLEVVSWNIENYPKLNEQTVFNVAEIIKDLDADIYGMQEIADTVSFQQLLGLLPNYAGTFSSDVYSSGSYQKTAVLYKKDIVQISDMKMLFTEDGYSFPRPPLQIYVTASLNQKVFDFTLITLHLKAFGGSENEARRRSACEKLKNYLDVEIANGLDKDFMVIGDWNDNLKDPLSQNVFQVFLNDSLNYTFLTSGLADDPVNNATYIGGYQSVIDHILISQDVIPDYANGKTEVLKIDLFFSAYLNEVSDHRPVAALFRVLQ